MKGLQQNISALRDNFIAHGLLSKQSDKACVDLKDIKELVEKGIAIFQALSFEPEGFYSWIEGDGYDFTKLPIYL